MKKLITKFLYFLCFILCFIPTVIAQDLNISSVTYDNSSAFLSINSFDNEEFKFVQTPKLVVVTDENKAYFDIESAVLRCQQQDLVMNSDDISQIAVKQFSTDPNIVRVVIRYNDKFNPNTIQLRQVNNTLFVRFKHPTVQNYYFNQIYSDVSSSINKIFEAVSIQIPVKVVKNNILSQINSAFNSDNDVDYVLNKKDLLLQSRYYLDNVDVKTNSIHIIGNGVVSLTKPFILSNPTRLVYDIPNAVVNPVLRNKEIRLNESETLKIGQFNRETARIVITSENVNSYMPVIYPDSQRLVFIDKKSTSYQALYQTKTLLNSVNDEINDSKTHSVKMVFSKPVIFGIDRSSKSLDLMLLNASRSDDLNLKSTFLFEGSKITNLKNGGLKVSIPLKDEDIVDIHSGVNAKTLRIKITSKILDLPQKDEKVTQSVVAPSTLLSRDVTKKLVVLDPGHGGGDHGAIRGNVSEKDITLDVSKRVRELLEKKGYEVFMTREIDETVSLQERVEISENLVPDIFVSVHVNSSNSESPNGIETHYYKDNSLILAKIVHASMLNHVQANDRGLFKSKFYVINHTTAPAILLEIGFISNPIERVQLITDFRKQATAKAIAEGIDDYFKKY